MNDCMDFYFLTKQSRLKACPFPFWHKVTRAFVSMCLSQCYFLKIEKNMNDCMDFYFLTKHSGWLLLHSPDKCLSVHS